MERPYLYINQYVKTQSYLSYLIAIYVFQVKSSFFEKPKLHPFFVLKQSFGIFSLL